MERARPLHTGEQCACVRCACVSACVSACVCACLRMSVCDRHLLRHELAEHGDHREAAVLELLQLLVAKHLRVLRLEAEEGWDLAGLLGVVLLGNRELVHADERNDLEPARSRNRVNRGDAARDVVEVEAERRGQQLVRRLEELRAAAGRRRQAAGTGGVAAAARARNRVAAVAGRRAPRWAQQSCQGRRPCTRGRA
jgi:hypothetical protein